MKKKTKRKNNSFGRFIKKLISDNRFIAALSLIIALTLWIIVSVNVSAASSKVIKDIPISIDTTDLNANFGLDRIAIVDPPALSSGLVDVSVYGSIYQLSGVSAEDISVVAQTGGVNRAGEYTLMLSVSCSNKDVRVSLANNYSFVKVWFDRLMSKNLSVDRLSVSGVSTAAEDLIIGDYYSSIKTLTVNGPESIIETLDSAQIRAELDEKLSETKTVTGVICFMDTSGTELDSTLNSYLMITDFNDAETSTGTSAGAPAAEDITITVPIRKIITLPLKLSFRNAPSGFDASTLKYKLSVSSISLEGDIEAIDKLTEIGYYELDSIDLSSLSPENKSFSIKLNLSSGVEEQNGINEVDVNFDLSKYMTKTISIAGSGYFSFVDVPNNVNASLASDSLDVVVIGPENELQKLTLSDLSVSISLEGHDGTSGQKRMSATVTLKNATHCWVAGSYSIMVSFD